MQSMRPAGPRPPARAHRTGWQDAREAHRADRPHEAVDAAESALEPWIEARLRREEVRNVQWLAEWYVRAADAIDHPIPRKFRRPVLAVARSEMDHHGYDATDADAWTDETLEAELLPFYERLRAEALAYIRLYQQFEMLRGDSNAAERARRELVDEFLDRPPLPTYAEMARDLLAERNPGPSIPLVLVRYERSILARERRC